MLLKEFFDEPELAVADIVAIVEVCEQNKWLPAVDADEFIKQLKEASNG
jgi:hypothetical protein